MGGWPLPAARAAQGGGGMEDEQGDGVRGDEERRGAQTEQQEDKGQDKREGEGWNGYSG